MRCKFATAYVLHNFSNVLADWYFSWLYLNFHWLSFCGVFFVVYFLLGRRKKRSGKKPAKNAPRNSVRNIRPYALSRENKIFTTSITPSENSHDSYKLHILGSFSLECFFWEGIFRIWLLTFLSFMMMSFFENLSKTFGK